MKPPLYVDQPHHEWQSYADEFLQRFVQAIGHMPEGVSTRFFVGAGDPASEILRFARELEADLAVLVWHGDAGEPHGRRVSPRPRGLALPRAGPPAMMDGFLIFSLRQSRT